MKRALITGITGQDGSYLAELLLEKGYEVHGIIRRSSSFNTGRINHVFDKIHLHYGDLSDSNNLYRIIKKVKPDEIYNLAAQSHVRVSFDIPEYTANIVALGALRLLEIVRIMKEEEGKNIKYYQASSSEMFGKVAEVPQTENTPFYPRSPYGCSKVFAYWITKNYRESYGMFACNGILFNHESSRRGQTFVTKKIVDAAKKIKSGEQECLYLGNLDARRDWGHAKEYVEAMWLMLQQEEPDDYVVATGETHSVRTFLYEAFNHIGISLISNNKSGIEEEFIDKDSGKIIVRIDEKYYRPAEVDLLIGNPTKANEKLGWKPKILIKELI
jgi:GDPmannose 4,6-dehydratase